MSITAAELIALVKVSGVEESAAKLVSLGGTVDSVGGKLGGLATGAALVAGAAFVGLGALSVKMAADFQQGLTLLTTSANESQKNLGMVGAGILKMSVDTATGADKLENAMFVVESAGYHGAAGLAVLKAAAEGAKIENADLTQVTQALTTTMHDWQEPANQAIDVMNSFREAAALGNMRMDDFTGAMKNVGPVASLAKIPLTDIEAALSTMSLEGDKGASAGTHLAQSLLNMIAPSTKAQKVLQEIGLTAQQVSDDMKKSLPDTLKEITDDIGKKFPKGSEAYNHALSDMFGGTRGLKAILELTGANLKDFTKDAADLAPIMKQNATNVDGWAQVQGNFNFKLQAAGDAMQVLLIKAGTQLLPIFSKMLDAVTPLIVSFSNWIDKDNVLTNAFNATASAVQRSINFYQQWKPVIDTTAGALAFFFVPAVIKSGVEALISAGKITYGYVTSLIATGFEGWGAAFKLAAYIGAVIATGVQAVISAGKITFNFIASLIATGVQAYVAAYAVSGSFVPALGMVGMQAVAAAGKITGTLLPALKSVGPAAAASESEVAAAGTSTVTSFGIAAAGIVTAGIAAIIGIEAYMLKDALPALITSWNNADFKPPPRYEQAQIAMRNQAQQTSAKITATVADMRDKTVSTIGDMAGNIQGKMASLGGWMSNEWGTMQRTSLSQASQLSDGASRLIAQLKDNVIGDMSTMDDSAKGYWNDIAAYIAGHPISGNITYTVAGGPVAPGGPIGAPSHHFASGTDSAPGGWSWVGERGPELMHLPAGTQVIPHDRSMGMGGKQEIHVHVYLDKTRLTREIAPELVNQIRTATGVRF